MIGFLIHASDAYVAFMTITIRHILFITLSLLHSLRFIAATHVSNSEDYDEVSFADTLPQSIHAISYL